MKKQAQRQVRGDGAKISAVAPAPVGGTYRGANHGNLAQSSQLAVEDDVLEQIDGREAPNPFEGGATGEDGLIACRGLQPPGARVNRSGKRSRDQTVRAGAAELNFEASANHLWVDERASQRSRGRGIEPGVGVQEDEDLAAGDASAGVKLPSASGRRLHDPGATLDCRRRTIAATAVDDDDLDGRSKGVEDRLQRRWEVQGLVQRRYDDRDAVDSFQGSLGRF